MSSKDPTPVEEQLIIQLTAKTFKWSDVNISCRHYAKCRTPVKRRKDLKLVEGDQAKELANLRDEDESQHGRCPA